MVNWNRCQCKSPYCRYLHPMGLGTFYPGSGFNAEEAAELDAALTMFRALPKRDQYTLKNMARKRIDEALS